MAFPALAAESRCPWVGVMAGADLRSSRISLAGAYLVLALFCVLGEMIHKALLHVELKNLSVHACTLVGATARKRRAGAAPRLRDASQ